MKTVRLTMAQALVRFLENQYMEVDGAQHRFVRGVFIIPGHGNVVGLGQALSQEAKHLEIYQGKNEQGMAQAAVAFAKQMKRKQICVATSSVGPGAANMVTACGTATANNIPLLVLPGDTYACRQPDPVLQQVEHTNSLATTTNDAFKAVCRYWDRVVRPEQLMSAMINAFRVLTDPANTGAVCVAMPQDVEGEAYDYPVSFFAKRVWRLERRPATEAALADAAEAIQQASSLGIDIPFIGSDTLDDNKVLAAAQGTNIQLYVSTFYQEGGSPEFDKGIKDYINNNASAKSDNGGDDTISAVTAMGYDVYYVALEALKAAGSTDPAKVMEALPGVTYDGVSGHIAFDDENGDAVRDTAYIKHSTNDGAWELETQQTVQ